MVRRYIPVNLVPAPAIANTGPVMSVIHQWQRAQQAQPGRKLYPNKDGFQTVGSLSLGLYRTNTNADSNGRLENVKDLPQM